MHAIAAFFGLWSDAGHCCGPQLGKTFGYFPPLEAYMLPSGTMPTSQRGGFNTKDVKKIHSHTINYLPKKIL